MKLKHIVIFALVCGVAACAKVRGVLNASEVSDPPVMAWDFHDSGPLWTEVTMGALQTHGAALPALVPGDIETWCPGYEHQDDFGRRAFWSGMISILAKHESRWQPRVEGGGGRWIGLLQIAPATARGYGCEAGTVAALKDGPANLSCAVRIMATTVTRDGVVSRGLRGVAADWGPFHSSSKHQDMIDWTRAQDYCQ